MTPTMKSILSFLEPWHLRQSDSSCFWSTLKTPEPGNDMMASHDRPTIFRQQALEHLSTPEQLDQLLQVVNRKSWIPLATVAALLLLSLVWSISGEIPITADGLG